MSARLAWLGTLCAALTGCAAPAPDTPVNAELAAIEARSGGRLGVALVDGAGRPLAGYRADERFAMCSTFKLPLAAMALDRVAGDGLKLDGALVVTPADMVPHAPYVEAQIAQQPPASVTVEGAASAAVSLSDNVAANLLLDQLGGPQGLTAWLRASGDSVTRLDRREPDLNENAPGDPRDTSSPAAMAQTAHRLVTGKTLPPAQRAMLLAWLRASQTGLGRIRASLPPDWAAGDKTGTCGTAFNDVAVFTTPDKRAYALAVYLDRPAVKGGEANAVIADAARVVVSTIR